MNHLMIDMEFLDTRPTAAILSIGAVFFDPEEQKIGNTFYTTVSADDCVRRHGMTISADTVKWWIDQDIKAIKAAFDTDKVMMLELALIKFANFVSSVPSDKLIVWSQGSIDLEILKFAWTKLSDPKAKIPWMFRNERDLRTAWALFPNLDVPRKSGTTKHNALDDAINQANVALAIHAEINKRSTGGKVKKVEVVAPVEQDEEL